MTPMGPFINEMRDRSTQNAELLQPGARDGANGGWRGGRSHVGTPRGASLLEQDHEQALILPVRRVVHSDVETAPECTTHPTPPSNAKNDPPSPSAHKEGR
jgi:hypothetical protein